MSSPSSVETKFSTIASNILTNNNMNVNITTTSYANLTLKDVQPLWVSYSTLTNSSFFFICYLIYFLVVALFLQRVSSKNQLKRNHKILLTLTVIFVGIQTFIQLLRIANDSLQVRGRQLLESQQLVGLQFFVAMNVMGGVTTFFTFSNFISFFIILFVVQNIFWETAKLVRSISEKSFKIIRVTICVVNVIFIVLTLSLVILTGVCYSLLGLGMIAKNVATSVFVCVFVIVVYMIVFDSIMVLTSGILVIKTIKTTAANTVKAMTLRPLEKQTSRSSFDLQTFERRVQSPFKITFGLLIAMLVCMSMEIIAGGIASAVAEIETLRLVWYIFNCGGILIFAIIILFLFFPLFFGNEHAFAEIEKRSNIHSNHLQKPVHVNESVGSENAITNHSKGEKSNSLRSINSVNKINNSNEEDEEEESATTTVSKSNSLQVPSSLSQNKSLNHSTTISTCSNCSTPMSLQSGNIGAALCEKPLLEKHVLLSTINGTTTNDPTQQQPLTTTMNSSSSPCISPSEAMSSSLSTNGVENVQKDHEGGSFCVLIREEKEETSIKENEQVD
nr:unnamed protein product [Naegleria fowleri]